MWKYVIKRLLWLIPIVLGVAILIFTIMYFTPGDPAQIMLGSTATEEQIAAKRAEMGLDQPYIVQLGKFLLDTARLDFGTSYLRDPDHYRAEGKVPENADTGTFVYAGLASGYSPRRDRGGPSGEMAG